MIAESVLNEHFLLVKNKTKAEKSLRILQRSRIIAEHIRLDRCSQQ